MPLFFVLAGLFLWSTVGKQDFLASRWSQLIYPYLLWSAVTAALEIAMARYVNSPLSIQDALLIPVEPIEQYWFLYTLFVCQLVAFLAFPRKWLLLPLAGLGLGLVSVVGGDWIVVRSFLYLPFVLLGIFGKKAFQALATWTMVRQLLVAALAWGIFAALWINGVEGLGFLLGVTGAVGAIALAMVASRSKALGLLGRASLAIYLMHTIFSAGCRIALGWVGIAPESIASVTMALVVGLLAPLLIWEWARQADRTKALGLGG